MPTTDEAYRRGIIKNINAHIQVHGPDLVVLNDLVTLCREEVQEVADFDKRYWFQVSKYAKATAARLLSSTGNPQYGEAYYAALLFEAPHLFESYLYYMERYRNPKDRFYEPRAKTLGVVAHDLQDLEDQLIKFYGLSLPSRTGKALAKDTPVLTSNGWKNHGDLRVGDKVIGEDGRFKKVLAVHPDCEMEYKVMFSDGTAVLCHGNHEWKVYDRHFHEYKIRTTDEMASTLYETDGRTRYLVPLLEPVKGQKKGLKVDPYMLGVWLGDGRNTNPDICGPKSDYAIVQHILDKGYEIAWHTTHKDTGVEYYGIKGLRFQLQEYGMCHSRQNTPKHIPEEYLTASLEQRLELLAGLLDTDGTLRLDEHRYCFSTTEPRLRDDFITLVNSFGWRTCTVEYEPKTSSSGVVGRKTTYSIGFNPSFYIPCQLERKQLRVFSNRKRMSISEIERIPGGTVGNCITVEGGLYRVGRTLKLTHNSTIAIFFMSFHMGRHPESHNAMGGHSGVLAKGFHKELLNLIDTREYAFAEIFPGIISKTGQVIESKSAEDLTINLGKPDRFPTMTCRGIDGTWTGAIDISPDGILYTDDLIRDREHSLSAIREENTYQEYLNKMVDRMNDGAMELMIGTLWNVLDPLERERKKRKNDPYSRFRRIPALDEVTDESNFNYAIKGFSTEYYRNMRSRLEKAEWMAKFQQKPFVREGLLLPSDELRYWNGILPDGDYRIVAACDVAWGGGDSLSMPIGAEYESGDVYIIDWVFNSGPKEVTIPLVVGKILAYRIRQIRFEANNGGDMYCLKVSEELQKHKFACACTHKKAPGRMEKMSKMNAYAGDIKRNFIFLTDSVPSSAQLNDDAQCGIKRYYRSAEYQGAMDEATMTSMTGDNEHDDACDGLTQLAMVVERPEHTEATILKGGPWGRRGR